MATAKGLALLFFNNLNVQLTLDSASITGATWYPDGPPPPVIDAQSTVGKYVTQGNSGGFTVEFAYLTEGGTFLLTTKVVVDASGNLTATATSEPPVKIDEQTNENATLWFVTTTYSISS